MKAERKRDGVGSFKAESLQELKKEGKFFLLHWYDFIMLSVRQVLKQKPKEFFLLFFIALFGTIGITSFFIYSLINGIDIRFSMPTLSAPNFAQFQILGNGDTSSLRKFDPVVLAGKIKKGDSDYVLIDLRSQEEYDDGHITSAISVPVYGTELLKTDGTIDAGMVKEAFRGKLDKKIAVLYGHSAYSSFPYEVAAVLDRGGRKVKVLGLGWNEWAHFKASWVPEVLWDSLDNDQFVQVREE